MVVSHVGLMLKDCGKCDWMSVWWFVGIVGRWELIKD